MHGCEIYRDSLGWLAPVLRKWGHLVEEYCAHDLGDVPYYYSERANVGLLSAAAWSAGCVALEEYQSEKTLDGAQVRGRADLYIYNPTLGQGVGIEAKQCWLSPGSSERAFSDRMKEANSDALKRNDADRLAGAVFATLKVPEGQDIDDAFVTTHRMLKAQTVHLLAWAFPDSARQHLCDDRSKRPHYWPGVFLAIRRARSDAPA